MSDKMRKSLQERFNRLKKALKNALTLKREEAMPGLVLQPYRNKQRYER
jgi:hypothetical protein